MFKSFILPLLVLLQIVAALEIAKPTVVKGPIDLSVGDIHIKDGASYSVVNNGFSNIVGGLTVDQDAGFYISSTDSTLGLQVNLWGFWNNIENNGIVSFNALQSTLAPSFVLQGASFRNTGSFFLAADGGTPPTMTLAAPNWYNSGTVVIYQNSRSRANANLGSPLQTIVNDGSICFHNTLYNQVTSIQGSGCIVADAKSTIRISNAFLPIAPSQQFYLADSESSINVQPLSSPATFNVAGFGNGNKIGLSVSLSASDKAYSYDSNTGILTLTGGLFDSVSQHFNIGKGYDPAKFERVTDDSAGLFSTPLGAVHYKGDVPNKVIPGKCVCQNPPTFPTVPTS
ncbi:hypothetical protein I9W82_001767 [Candida metapsilosis]|uniref:Hyphally-regulated cell wall protein N-terminal domain-containing protein n=1 Tax=Candida metapsilosis TaxID=273372 RepID=A0A8H8DC31_9ASCO|nr:hypothetical protein I9W82_001767 [Candida metapsilosis]